MTNIAGNERRFYQAQTSSTLVNLMDLKNLFLRTEVGASGNTKDLEMKWLRSKGATKVNIGDMWREFLLSEGYTGQLQDMKNQYYIDNS